MKGKDLRSIRTKLGWTQVELAKSLRVTANTVARWERDERTITDAMALLIQKISAENRAKR
jgi:transcriptional regulator with XRE-family HTH domain